LIEEISPVRWFSGGQILKRLAEAFDLLPDRCREVVWLRRVDELSQREVAMRLGISEKTVEKHVAKGMRLMAGYFYGGGAEAPSSAPSAGIGSGHGQQRTD
jgi:RNA polymerase sigma-70 factor (ECF subfamily)